MPLFSCAPNSLCLLRLSAIGDCCHAVALVQAIQRQWPTTKITWIMGKVEAQLLGDLPGVTVLPFDKGAGLAGYRQIWQQLRHQRFDALLHLQSALRASLLSLGVRARYRLGFDQARASDGQWLFTNHKVPSPSSPHVLDGFMAFAAALGVQDLTPRWHIPVSDADAAWAAQRLGEAPTLLLCPASSKAYKDWTVAGYAALAQHAVNRGLQVVLCGGPAPREQALAEAIQAACPVPLTNLVGQTRLKQLQALIAHARLVAGPDSGPLHMATAAGTPALGLYAHHNPARTGPYRNLDDLVSVYQPLIEAQTGRSLAQLPWRSRLKDEHAMSQLPVAEVLAAFDRLLTKSQGVTP